MVLRKKYLKILETVYDSVLNGERRVLLLRGEEKIGRSELVKTFIKLRKAQVPVFIDTDAIEAERSAPYRVISNILFELQNKMSYANIDYNIEELQYDYPPSFIEQIIYSKLLNIFNTAAYYHPIIIFVQNIEHSDIQSLNFLTYFFREIKYKSIMFIATYSPITGSDMYFQDHLKLWLKLPNVEEVIISSFSKEEYALFLKENGYIIPNYVMQRLYTLTNGLPGDTFKLLEKLKEMQYINERNVWVQFDPDWEEIIVPETATMLVYKYTHLDYQSRLILNNAAIIGEHFSKTLLLRISNIAAQSLDYILNQLLQQRLITPHNGNFKFVNYSFYQYVYQTISNVRKHVIHRKIAELLEQDYGDVAALAYHYSRAGVRDKAYIYNIKAGIREKNKYEYSTALRFFKKAEKFKPFDVEIKLLIAEIHKELDNHKESLKYYDLAAPEASEKQQIQIYLGKAENYERMGMFSKALQYYQLVLNLTSEQDVINRAQAYRGLANVHKRNHNLKVAHTYILMSLKLIKSTNELLEIAKTYKDLGSIYYYENMHDKAEYYYFLALYNYLNLGYFVGVAKIYNNLGNIYTDKFHYIEAINYFEKAINYASKVGCRVLFSVISHNIALLYFYISELEQYIIHLKDAFKSLLTMQETYIVPLLNTTLGDYEKLKGTFMEALKHYQKSLELYLEKENKYGASLAVDKILELLLIVEDAVDLNAVQQHWHCIERIEDAKKELIYSKIQYYKFTQQFGKLEPLAEQYLQLCSVKNNIPLQVHGYLTAAEVHLLRQDLEKFSDIFKIIEQYSQITGYNDLWVKVFRVINAYIDSDPQFTTRLSSLEKVLKKFSFSYVIMNLYLYLGIAKLIKEKDSKYLKKAKTLAQNVNAKGLVKLIDHIIH